MMNSHMHIVAPVVHQLNIYKRLHQLHQLIHLHLRSKWILLVTGAWIRVAPRTQFAVVDWCIFITQQWRLTMNKEDRVTYMATIAMNGMIRSGADYGSIQGRRYIVRECVNIASMLSDEIDGYFGFKEGVPTFDSETN